MRGKAEQKLKIMSYGNLLPKGCLIISFILMIIGLIMIVIGIIKMITIFI